MPETEAKTSLLIRKNPHRGPMKNDETINNTVAHGRANRTQAFSLTHPPSRLIFLDESKETITQQ